MKTYLIVTADKFELPMFGADTLKEIANKTKLAYQTVRICCNHATRNIIFLGVQAKIVSVII
ncbi:MAG: hypothetical protein WCO84_00975 [bacterium]